MNLIPNELSHAYFPELIPSLFVEKKKVHWHSVVRVKVTTNGLCFALGHNTKPHIDSLFTFL